MHVIWNTANNTTVVSFYFRLTAPGKNLEHAQNAKSNSNVYNSNVYMHA